MADQLKEFEANVRAEHAKLTAAYEAAQAKAAEAKAAENDAGNALTAFREKYGKVLKAFEGGAESASGVTATGALNAPAVKAKG